MIDQEESLKKNILLKLNVEIGKDRKNIALVKEKLILEQQEILDNHPKIQEIKNTIEELESSLNKIQEIKDKFQILNLEYLEQEKKLSPVSSKIQDNIDKINQIELGKTYLICLKWIEDTNQELMIEYENPYGLDLYIALCKLTVILTTSHCSHLFTYAKQTCHYWFGLLKEKYSPAFEESINIIKWPFTSSNVSVTKSGPSHDSLIKFKKNLKILCKVQYPSRLNPESLKSSQVINFIPPSLPIALLLKPLQKRFVYHFTSSKQTNRIDKPEWFLTLILTWIRDHQEFIDRHIQPIFHETGRGNAKAEFMRGLVQVCVEKLLSDMNSLVSNDLLFSHAVDEVLGFEKELRDIYSYPSTEPSVLQVFTQTPVLIMWIELEGKFARDKMDMMFESDTAWCESHSGNEEIRIYECSESFILLLSTMTERYEALPHLEHKSQFLDLQLTLIDEFRLRLMQVMHETEELVPCILNTAHYIHTMLNEWSGTLHFILLQQYKMKSGLGQTVFDDLLNLLEKMINDLRSMILKTDLSQIKRKSRSYCNENWFGKEINSSSDSNLTFTPSGCLMVKEISTRLHNLHQRLAVSLFTFIWESLAQRLCDYLFDELVMANKFSKAGGKQLHFDLSRNLLPLFAQYTTKPERFFNKLLEASQLLSMDQVPKNPLNGIRYLSREECFRVLRNRSDMNIKVNIADIE